MVPLRVFLSDYNPNDTLSSYRSRNPIDSHLDGIDCLRVTPTLPLQCTKTLTTMVEGDTEAFAILVWQGRRKSSNQPENQAIPRLREEQKTQ
jgi:hypothetical protein